MSIFANNIILGLESIATSILKQNIDDLINNDYNSINFKTWISGNEITPHQLANDIINMTDEDYYNLTDSIILLLEEEIPCNYGSDKLIALYYEKDRERIGSDLYDYCKEGLIEVLADYFKRYTFE